MPGTPPCQLSGCRPPPPQETVNNLRGWSESFKKLNMLEIHSQNSTITVLFFLSFCFVFFFFMSWLVWSWKDPLSLQTTPTASRKKHFSPKLRERRLLRLDLWHNKNQWGAQSLSREGRCWGPDGKSRTYMSWSPRCQLRTSALPACAHARTRPAASTQDTHAHARRTANPYPKYESSSYWSIWGTDFVRKKNSSAWMRKSFLKPTP